MRPPVFSIIIPCFNCAATLRRCVEGVVAAQAACEAASEVLLIDGGSSDATSEVCAALAREGLAQVIAGTGSTASEKRNAGLRQANGDFLLFTDPDCIPAPGWLAAYAALCGEEGCWTGRVLPWEAGLETSIRKSPKDQCYAPHLLHRALPFRPGSSNNLLIARGLLARIGGFPEDLGPGTPNGVAEDTEVIYKVFRAGLPVRYVAAALVYHDHPENEAAWLQKKAQYGEGLSFFFFRRYAGDPAAWLSLAILLAHISFWLAAAFLGGNTLQRRQYAGELRGRVRGVWRALRHRREDARV